MPALFIEETAANGFTVVWRGESFKDALMALQTLDSSNRLELWSQEHAESPKGFTPMAYRDKNSKRVLIGNTLKMLLG